MKHYQTAIFAVTALSMTGLSSCAFHNGKHGNEFQEVTVYTPTGQKALIREQNGRTKWLLPKDEVAALLIAIAFKAQSELNDRNNKLSQAEEKLKQAEAENEKLKSGYRVEVDKEFDDMLESIMQEKSESK